PGRIAEDVSAHDARGPGRRRDERGEHAKARRLAGAVGAEKGDELSACGGEGEVGDRFDLRLLDGEDLAQALCFDDGFVSHAGSVETNADRSGPRSLAVSV